MEGVLAVAGVNQCRVRWFDAFLADGTDIATLVGWPCLRVDSLHLHDGRVDGWS